MTTKTTWLTDYLEVWAACAGTVVAALPAARAARTFKALEGAFGRADVLARWQTAWRITPEQERRYLTPETFARRYGDFQAPEVDAFGFVVETAEQRDVASKIVAALSDDREATVWLCEKFSIPLHFPRGAIVLRAYEAIRGSHERSVRQYAEATKAAQQDATVAENRRRLVQALS